MICGSPVDLVVSNGSPPLCDPAGPLITVVVAGMTENSARTAIADAGLVLGNTLLEFDDVYSKGRAVSTDPVSAVCGSVVDLIISDGPFPCESGELVTVVVAGMSEIAARTAIEDAGLLVGEIILVNSSTIPEGSAVSTDLETETCGGEVDLWISKGPDVLACLPEDDVPVPDVVGMTEIAAGTAIVEAGLTVGNTILVFSSDPEESVVSTVPSEKQICGGVVDLYISKGPEVLICLPEDDVTVPEVVGMSENAARTAIVDAGLTVGNIIPVFSSDPEGSVVSTVPSEKQICGGAVDLWISDGPEPAMCVPGLVEPGYDCDVDEDCTTCKCRGSNKKGKSKTCKNL